MLKQDFLQEVSHQRRDIGNLLIHLTRTPERPIAIERSGRTLSASPRNVLEKIASDGRILGGSEFIKGGYRCVCFTEAPIAEIPTIVRLARDAAEISLRPRYEPYGVAVPKEWLFARGGRPVIYQSEDEFLHLPEEMRYRHVRYEPGNVDFTWEREWRIQTDDLVLDPKSTLFIMPKADEVFDFMYGHATLEAEWDDLDNEGLPTNFYHKAKWMAVSLDLFGQALLTE